MNLFLQILPFLMFNHGLLWCYHGRWFGQYQPGFPLILAAGIRLGQPWLVNPILSALTILLLYLLGKNLFSRGTGLLAALLALFSPFILFMSGSLMAHPAELFWVTSFMLCWTLALRRDQRRWPLLAGLSLGMILLTRQAAAAAAALPFLLIMAVGELLEKRQWRPLLKKTSLLLAAALPLAILLLFYQNKLTGDPFRDPRQIARPFDRIGFGLDVGETPNAFRLEWNEGGQVVDWIFDPQQPPRGHTLARGIYNTVQNWRALERELFGWPPIFTLAFLWLAFLAAKPAKADFALLAVIAATILVYILYWSDGMMYGPRYYYAALPALLLLTARGIQAAALWLGRGGQSAAALLAALLIAGSLLFHLPARIDSHRGYNFISAQERAQVANAVSPPAIVFIEQDPLNWWEYGRFFSANTPWLDGPIIYARDLGSTQNAKLRAQYPGRQAYIRRADGQLVSYEQQTAAFGA